MADIKVSEKKDKSLKSTEISKADIKDEFRGGLAINLDRKMENGQSLREKLSAHIYETLDQELKNQDKLIEAHQHWQRQYKGIRDEKNFPFPKCSNIAAPITRSDVDAIFVRILESIFNKAKIVIVRALKPEFVDYAPKLEEGLNHWLVNQVNFREKIFSPLLQCVKTGTGITKTGFESKKKTVYRYATEEEQRDKKIKKYDLQGTGDKAVKTVETTYSGPQIYPVPREKFVISSDGLTIEDAYLVGFNKDLRKPQIELKVKQTIYDKNEADKLIQPDKFDSVTESRAKEQGKELIKTKYEEPYQIWELWFSYDVDEDGEEDSIVITWHQESRAILRAIYNPLFADFKPFCDYVFNPIEFSFEGEGICQILEKVQVAIDTIINQRIDRLTQINAPITLVRAGSGLENFTLAPGTKQICDDDLNAAVRIISFSESYYPAFNEEDRLIAQADRAIGITPGTMGISTAERPVAQEVMQLQQEANKKFAAGIDNIRRKITNQIKTCVEFFGQYQPVYQYTTELGGKFTEKTIDFPLDIIRNGLSIELFASSELLNQEIRRQVNLTIYHMLGDYYTKTAGMVQAILSPNIPPEFKKFLLASIEVGEKLMERILRDFEQRDADALVVNLKEVIDVNKALQPPPPPPPPPPPQRQPMGPEGGMVRPEQGGMPPPEMGGQPPPPQGGQMMPPEEEMGPFPRGSFPMR